MLLSYLERRSPGFIILLSFLLTALVGLADYLTGPELSSAIFYVLPIALSSWCLGAGFGAVISVLSAVAWLVADQATAGPYAYSWIPFWNGLVRLLLFLLLVYLFANFRSRLREEQRRAKTDALTGVLNTRAFQENVDHELERSRRYRHPIAIAYLDLDNFKAVNDAYGHTAGDVVLRRVANTLLEHTRGSDIIARLGGDEFALVFAETGREAAKAATLELQRQLSRCMQEMNCPVTFSIGLATYERAPQGISDLVNAADELMYRVKRQGKNGFLELHQPMEQQAGPDYPTSGDVSQHGLS